MSDWGPSCRSLISCTGEYSGRPRYRCPSPRLSERVLVGFIRHTPDERGRLRSRSKGEVCGCGNPSKSKSWPSRAGGVPRLSGSLFPGPHLSDLSEGAWHACKKARRRRCLHQGSARSQGIQCDAGAHDTVPGNLPQTRPCSVGARGGPKRSFWMPRSPRTTSRCMTPMLERSQNMTCLICGIMFLPCLAALWSVWHL